MSEGEVVLIRKDAHTCLARMDTVKGNWLRDINIEQFGSGDIKYHFGHFKKDQSFGRVWLVDFSENSNFTL